MLILNQLIYCETLMKESVLMTFLEHYYNTIAISNIKKAFLVKDLSELKFSPLDLEHYSTSERVFTTVSKISTLASLFPIFWITEL